MLATTLLAWSAHLPKRPYCTDALQHGLQVRPLESALNRRYLQLNPPGHIGWLVFDVDRPGAAFAWADAHLPPPTWCTTSPSGHAHLVYHLVDPVFVDDPGNQRPHRFVTAIHAAIHRALGADPGYRGPVTRNPLHKAWWTIQPAGSVSYTLQELHEWVHLDQFDAQCLAPVGSRNWAIFDSLRHLAYRLVRTGTQTADITSRLSTQGELLNQSLPDPLPAGEVRTIVRSIVRWIARNYSCRSLTKDFRSHQAARGMRKGLVKRLVGLKLLSDGLPVSKLQQELRVSRATAYRWKATVDRARVAKPNQVSAVDKKPCRVDDRSSQSANRPSSHVDIST